MKKLLVLVLMALSVSAYAASSQPVVELNPQPTLNATAIGNHKAVDVQVIDARATGYGSANIDPQQNVQQIFSDQVNKALTAYGFNPVKTDQAPNQLIVRIESINYSVAKGYFGSNTETTVSASIQAKNDKGTYSNTYLATAYGDNYLRPGKQTPSEQVNTAVNQVLTNMLNDQSMMQFLGS